MARPPDTKAKRIERRAAKAVALINSGMPRMKAYRAAGIPQKSFWNWITQARMSERGIEFMVRLQNAQAQ